MTKQTGADDQVAMSTLGEISAGAHRLTVRAATQENQTSPVAVILPAMGVPASFYRPFVRNLHERGLTVVTFDLRGQGEATPSPARNVRIGYQNHIDDAAAVVDLVAAAFPDAPRFLLGHSLGGHVALLYAAEHPGRVAGVSLLASGSVWFRSFEGSRVWRNLVGTQLVAAVSSLLGYWPGQRFGFGGRQSVDLMRDWARQGRTGRYELAGSRSDFEAGLRQLRIPVLTVSIEGDDLAPASSVDHLIGKAGDCDRAKRHYTPELAGATKLSHFSWVHSSAPLSQWISEWIETSHVPGEAAR